MSKFLRFSEGLERNLSNYVFKSNIRQIGKYFYLPNMNFDDTIWKVSF